MNIATHTKKWNVTIGLIGEGEEIYSGEKVGLSLWDTAIIGKNITVHSKYPNSLFTNAKNYQIHEHLHLNSYLRTHTELKYYEIIQCLKINENLEIDSLNDSQQYLAFQNDIYDLRNNRLLDHDSNYYLTNIIRANYSIDYFYNNSDEIFI